MVSRYFSYIFDDLKRHSVPGYCICPAFGSFSIVISLESRIILYNIMSCLYEGIAQYAGALLGHTDSFLVLKFSDRKTDESNPANVNILPVVEKR